MIDQSKRAIIVLASHDFEVLQVTLKSLDYSISKDELVIVILNGKLNYYGNTVEVIAREWAALNPAKRIVIRPYYAGDKAYVGITDVLTNSIYLKDINYICKIDDDIIPLKYGWMDRLAELYEEKSRLEEVGFVTGLINNNSWGFKRLIDIFDKYEEYKSIMNHHYLSVNGLIKMGEIADSNNSTVWQFAYLARWIHQWTSIDIDTFISKTIDLKPEVIPQETHYSIGCIFFKKEFWLNLVDVENSNDDEIIIHNNCLENHFSKWALMSEPIVHLFYYVHRFSNKDLLKDITIKLLEHFGNQSFINDIRWISLEDRLIYLEEKLNEFE